MARNHRQSLRLWKSLEISLRAPLRDMGYTSDDAVRIANAYVLWALVLKDLYFDEDPRGFSDACITNWLSRLVKLSCSYLSEQLKGALSLIRDWSPIMGDYGLPAFKQQAKARDIELSSVVFDLLRRPLYKFAKTYDGFWQLNTAVQFVLRLTLHDTSADEEVEGKFRELQTEMSGWDYDPNLLSELRLLGEKFPYDASRAWPHHSNGATVETRRGCGVEEKFNKFRWTYSSLQLAKKYDWIHPLTEESERLPNRPPGHFQSVPKGIDSKRGICFELVAHQYCQQAIADAMAEAFLQVPSFGFDPFNQDHNRDLALLGSQTLSYGTIDLSSASDTVSWKLIREIFPTQLWRDQARCRSTYVELPTLGVIPLETAHTSGSGTCFRSESLVFSLVIQLAQAHMGVHRRFAVYGDDLVVHRDHFDEVLRILRALHFKVNEEKTFYPGSVFTESCGIECYLGKDVSPCRLPRRYDAVSLQQGRPDSADGTVSLINRFSEYGFRNARSFLLQDYFVHLTKYPQFSDNPNLGILSWTDDLNYHLRHRRNIHLQRPEVLVDVFRPRDTIVSNGGDYCRYIQTLERYWLSQRSSLLLPEDRIETKVGPAQKAKRKTLWTPA